MIEQEEIQRRLNTFLNSFRLNSNHYLSSPVYEDLNVGEFLENERTYRNIISDIFRDLLAQSGLHELLVIDETYELLLKILVQSGIDSVSVALVYSGFSDQRKKLKDKEKRAQNEVEVAYTEMWSGLTVVQQKVALVIPFIQSNGEKIEMIHQFIGKESVELESLEEALRHLMRMGLIKQEEERIIVSVPSFFEYITREHGKWE